MRRVAALGGLGIVAPGRLRRARAAAPAPRAAAARCSSRGPTGAPAAASCCPAIRACLDAAERPGRRRDQGLADRPRTWPACGCWRRAASGWTAWRADGGDVLLTERVWTVSQLPGERDPLFTPRPQTRRPASACLAVSVARDGAGDDVGWLSYDVCRAAAPGRALGRGAAAGRGAATATAEKKPDRDTAAGQAISGENRRCSEDVPAPRWSV